METHLYFWGEKHREEKRKKCLQAKERQGCISRKTVNRSKDTLTMMNFIFGKKEGRQQKRGVKEYSCVMTLPTTLDTLFYMLTCCG